MTKTKKKKGYVGVCSLREHSITARGSWQQAFVVTDHVESAVGKKEAMRADAPLISSSLYGPGPKPSFNMSLLPVTNLI